MKVAIYARVSTSDKEQDPETQLLPLRDFIQVQGWDTFRTCIDVAPANDLAHRHAWRELLLTLEEWFKPIRVLTRSLRIPRSSWA